MNKAYLTNDIEDSFLTELDLNEAANVLGGLGADYSAAYGGYSSGIAFGAAIANENQRAAIGGYDVSGVDPYRLAAKSRSNARRISNDDYYLYLMGF